MFDPFKTCNSIKKIGFVSIPQKTHMTRNLGRIFREYSYRTEICVLKETADSRARRIFEILDVNDDGRKNTPKRLLRPIKTLCLPK